MNTRNNISYSNPTINFVGTENVCLVNHKKQTPKTTNLNGQLYKHYDESGKIESVAFDFKGNLLSKKQQVISSTVLKTALDNYETYLVDWTGLPNILDTTIFETSSEFDALNRVTKITLPENVNSERKEITPTYNRAGALERVSYDGTEYVKNIGYNAKGQRLLIAFGNDIMTRYCYHKITFRLLRQRSEKYVKTKDGNKFIYTPQSGTNKQDDGFNFDLVGNILKILHRVNDCGINGSLLGSDALDRNFDYDPLYRVVSADGRESDTQNQNDYLYSDAPAPGTPNANNVRAYTRKYAFDKLGNIQQLKQLGTNGFTRNFTYNTGHNTLQKVETPTPTLIEDFTYDACGNQLTAGTTRHYVWNAGNQLVTYYNQAGSADPTIFAQYDYSGMNRVSKLVKTGTTYERTIYIDEIFEYCILENGTTYEKNYVHVMDDTSRIAMVRIGDQFPDDIADAITYNLEDQIGSSCVRLNTIGTVIDKEEYYPFGDSSLRAFTKKRYRYIGKEKDLESGLYYYGARYYCAWTCRFISVDPLASDYPFYTPYNYAGNKPINKIDIDGMQEEGAETAPIEENSIPIPSDPNQNEVKNSSENLLPNPFKKPSNLSAGYVGLERNQIGGNTKTTLNTDFGYIKPFTNESDRFAPDEPSSLFRIDYTFKSQGNFSTSITAFRNHTKGGFNMNNGDYVHWGKGNSQIGIGAGGSYNRDIYKGINASLSVTIGIGPQFTRYQDIDVNPSKWGIRGIGGLAVGDLKISTPDIKGIFSLSISFTNVLHVVSMSGFETINQLGETNSYTNRTFATNAYAFTMNIKFNLQKSTK